MGKIEHYKVEGNRLVRDREHCPECGPGTFMAHHANRKSCGRCGHTISAADSAPTSSAPAGSDDSVAGDSSSD